MYDNLGINSSPPPLSTTVDVTGLNATGFLGGGGIPANASIAVPEGAAARAATSSFIPNQRRRPEASTWNFGIQRQFANNLRFRDPIPRNSRPVPPDAGSVEPASDGKRVERAGGLLRHAQSSDFKLACRVAYPVFRPLW
jgi:hypothetical protein